MRCSCEQPEVVVVEGSASGENVAAFVGLCGSCL